MTGRGPQVGDTPPVFERRTGLMAWNRFAAVYDEFELIHMDPDVARAEGLTDAIGMGNLRLAYAHAFVRSWRDDLRIESLTIAHRDVNLRHDVLMVGGAVTKVTPLDSSSARATLEFEIRAASGRLVDTGSATVVVSW